MLLKYGNCKKMREIFAYFKNNAYLCTRLEKMSTFKHRGVEQLVARQAHNLEVARSNPASATLKQPKRLLLFSP